MNFDITGDDKGVQWRKLLTNIYDLLREKDELQQETMTSKHIDAADLEVAAHYGLAPEERQEDVRNVTDTAGRHTEDVAEESIKSDNDHDILVLSPDPITENILTPCELAEVTLGDTAMYLDSESDVGEENDVDMRPPQHKSLGSQPSESDPCPSGMRAMAETAPPLYADPRAIHLPLPERLDAGAVDARAAVSCRAVLGQWTPSLRPHTVSGATRPHKQDSSEIVMNCCLHDI